MAWTDSQERAYQRAMAKMTRERGYPNIAQSYALAARDCPANCPCLGCASTRKENAEAKARRAKRVEAYRVTVN